MSWSGIKELQQKRSAAFNRWKQYFNQLLRGTNEMNAARFEGLVSLDVVKDIGAVSNEFIKLRDDENGIVPPKIKKWVTNVQQHEKAQYNALVQVQQLTIAHIGSQQQHDQDCVLLPYLNLDLTPLKLHRGVAVSDNLLCLEEDNGDEDTVEKRQEKKASEGGDDAAKQGEEHQKPHHQCGHQHDHGENVKSDCSNFRQVLDELHKAIEESNLAVQECVDEMQAEISDAS